MTEAGGGGLCVLEGGGHTCIHMYFIEATEECQNREKSPQRPLTPDDLLLKQPKAAEVVVEMNFWFQPKNGWEANVFRDHEFTEWLFLADQGLWDFLWCLFLGCW